MAKRIYEVKNELKDIDIPVLITSAFDDSDCVCRVAKDHHYPCTVKASYIGFVEDNVVIITTDSEFRVTCNKDISNETKQLIAARMTEKLLQDGFGFMVQPDEYGFNFFEIETNK